MNILTVANTGISRQALQKQARKQKLQRLFRGAYIDEAEYQALDISGKYCAQAEAFLLTHPELKPWGITAAALEGAPVLAHAPLHFSGLKSKAKSRQTGCVFHIELPAVPTISNRTAQILFECASSSPLPDALLSANYLLHRLSANENNELIAMRSINTKETEALIRLALDSSNVRVKAYSKPDASQLDVNAPSFLTTYSAVRNTGFSSARAELAWLDFAQYCTAYSSRRAIRKTLKAGLLFSDQIESPAESLLIARLYELGYRIPYLQVNILNPSSGEHLGRVDGLWPSDATQKGLYLHDSRHGRFLYSKQFGDADSIVVEFDGELKYRENYTRALREERLRQNAINNLGFRFVRLGWSDLMNPYRLHTLLEAAGVPRSRSRRIVQEKPL